MRVRTRFVTAAALTAALVLPLAVPAPAGAEPAPTPRSTPAIDAAAAWLKTQQESDGGFEVANFPGFETADAVLALAAAGQTEPGWDEADALAAVEAVTVGGKNGLDALDDLVDTPVSPSQAAKVIALDVVPLGLDAGDFDPSNDTEGAVDLLAIVQSAAGTGDYADLGAFGGQVYAAWALAALGETVPPALLAVLDAAQQANGSFHYSGAASGSGHDPDLTASVIIALTLAGRPLTDPTVRDAAVSLGLTQIWNGEWRAEFDAGNPNSTALVLQAAATLGTGSRPTCWRDNADIRFAGVRYPRPWRAIERRQLETGRVASPNDGFGINTFATSQAIQGLVAAEGSWPYAPEAQCLVAPMVSDARRLVNAHYFDLLGRLSDEAGAVFWAGQVQNGMSAAQVAHRISGTPEYGQRVAASLYVRYLDRAPTSVEKAEGGTAVLAGLRLVVMTEILASQEYFDKAGPTNDPTTFDQWLSAVFFDLFGRTPAETDYEAYEATGWSRERIVRALLRSQEGLGAVVQDIYHQILRRDVDTAGRDHWVGELRRGVSPERLVRLIAGSPEYVSATRQGPV